VTQAPLWGLGRVIALEHPESWGGLVDLAAEHSPDYAAAALLGELLAPDGEDQVAFREGERRVARLVSIEPGPAAALPRLLSNAAYLITGGTGQLGLRIASWMAGRGARHLILIGRRGLGTHDVQGNGLEDAEHARRVNALRSLEERGVSVRVIQADVGDEAQMLAVLGELRTSSIPLRGIVHAAGTMTRQPLVMASAATLQADLRAKAVGAFVLHRATQGMDLDFMIFFSSAAAVWGSGQFAAYAAANRFLDTLAHRRRALGQPALSVDWGPWEGEGIASRAVQTSWARQGVESLSDDLAFAALEELLAADRVQATVAKVDWGVFKPVYEARMTRPLFERLGATPSDAKGAENLSAPSRLIRRLQGAHPRDRRELLSAHVQEEVRRILGVAPSQPLDSQRGLFQMGMDSLMSVELARSLEAVGDIAAAMGVLTTGLARAKAAGDAKAAGEIAGYLDSLT